MSHPNHSPARATVSSRPAQSWGWIVPNVSRSDWRTASQPSTPALLGRLAGRGLRSPGRGAPLDRLLRRLVHRRVTEFQRQDQSALVSLHMIAQRPQRPADDRRGADPVALGKTAEFLHFALIETNRDSLFVGSHIKP
jgi:hypothetical protein